jgi:hypothetical protein
MQSKKATAVGLAFTVAAAQVTYACERGETINLDIPITSLTAETSASSDAGFSNVTVAADTMLDRRIRLPSAEKPKATQGSA